MLCYTTLDDQICKCILIGGVA